ncbi:MAG TPA: lysophospholipid acyltransferase family protein [Actinomycetota bacterium]|nr:lysophospholipid acyltransferase family protein [Actinomycetota bacterium]
MIGAVAEPWYQIAKAVAIPPVRFWFDLRIEGLEHIPATGPAIVACNHLSYLDPLTNANAVMRAGRRPRFLAKRDLFEIPVVGSAFRGAHQIPVQRGTGDQTPLLLAEEALARGEVVVIYPEGTVTTREDHLPMDGKTGTIRLSLASGVPIVPLVSWGSQAVWQKSGPGSLKFGRPVWTRIGAPFDVTSRRGEADDREAVKAMTADLMAHLTEMVEGLRARYPERWSGGG